MVYSKSQSRFLHFFGGQCGMEITVLLLLIVPLTVASPLRPTHRADADTVLSGDILQASGVKRSEDTQEEHAQALKIIPFHSEDKHRDLDLLNHNTAVMSRSRRASPGGCKLGTCHLHNLASTLYDISRTRGNDKSKQATDPQGYGR